MLINYLSDLFIAAIVLVPFYIIFRVIFIKYRKVGVHLTRELVLAFFIVFLGALIFLATRSTDLYASSDMIQTAQQRISNGHGIKLKPFGTILVYLKKFPSQTFVANIIGNIILFIPIGFFLPLLWQKWQAFWKIMIVAFLFPVMIETAQLFIPRRFVDIDDVILNALGIMLGYGLYLLIKRAYPKVSFLSHP